MSARPPCGTPQGYRWHLRDGDTDCAPCRSAYSRYVKANKHRRGRFFRPAGPTAARIRELRATGVTLTVLAARTGVSDDTLWQIQSGRTARVTPRTEAAVRAVTVDPVATGRVPSVGTVRRIRALLALGWPHALISADCGHATSIITAQRRGSVTVETAQHIRATYDRLSMRIGPSPITAARAAKLKYPKPLQWDDEDIDNPDAVPAAVGSRATGCAHDRYLELIDLGCTHSEIALKYGVDVESVVRTLRRAEVAA